MLGISKLLVGAHQIDREYRVQKALEDTPVPVPKVFTYCDDESVIGAQFCACFTARPLSPPGVRITPLLLSTMFMYFPVLLAPLLIFRWPRPSA